MVNACARVRYVAGKRVSSVVVGRREGLNFPLPCSTGVQHRPACLCAWSLTDGTRTGLAFFFSRLMDDASYGNSTLGTYCSAILSLTQECLFCTLWFRENPDAEPRKMCPRRQQQPVNASLLAHDAEAPIPLEADAEPTVTLSWRNVNAFVAEPSDQKKRKQILFDASGDACPGEILAIMGYAQSSVPTDKAWSRVCTHSRSHSTASAGRLELARRRFSTFWLTGQLSAQRGSGLAQ